METPAKRYAELCLFIDELRRHHADAWERYEQLAAQAIRAGLSDNHIEGQRSRHFGAMEVLQLIVESMDADMLLEMRARQQRGDEQLRKVGR